ncbi:hypothetical protein BKA70DRAFT_1526561 [Coprinopsis sp. MPI-PUGE-AT-0042]|nr:hypothetical protein BKA70DRAFT_1526561 [Coprinopsis sp. MPI-PUGE-AT-0042]
MAIKLELEINEMKRKLGQSYGGIVPRSVFKKEERRLRSNHRARMNALKARKERERAMRVLEWSKMGTAPTTVSQLPKDQTPDFRPVLPLPNSNTFQGEDDARQETSASRNSEAAPEDLFDETEDDSAAEYEDALSSFSEDGGLWREEGCMHREPSVRQRSAGGRPVATTSEETAAHRVQGPLAEDDGKIGWYPNVESEDFRTHPRNVASIIIEEDEEEEEETCTPGPSPAVQTGSHTTSHRPLDLSKNQKPSSQESGPSRCKERQRRHQRYSNFPEAESKSSPPFLNVPPRKLHHPRPHYQSQPFAPQSQAKASSGQRHGAPSTSRRSSSTFEGAEAVEVTGGSFVAASTSSIVNNTYNYHYNTTANHFCGHGTSSQPCCRQCRSRSL